MMLSPLDGGSPSRPAGSSGGGATQNQAIATRVAILGAILLALFAVVFFRLWYLQVLSGESLAAEASQNRTRTVVVNAPRGEIVDRNGRRLVRNRQAQIVELAPNSLPDVEREVAAEYGQALGDWDRQLVAAYTEKRVRGWKQVPKEARERFPKPTVPDLRDPVLLARYAKEGDAGALKRLEQRYERLGWLLELDPAEVRRRVIRSLYLLPYANIPLRDDAKGQTVQYIAENAEEFPGVSTTERFVRSYPHHGLAAQIFGQVGAIPVDEDGASRYDKYAQLLEKNPNANVGVGGLEFQYDEYLRGRDGYAKTTIDAFGTPQGEPEIVQPQVGQGLQLTLDLNLTETAQKQLDAGSEFNAAGNPGGLVAMDPRDGAILAIASSPTFDPADFVRGVSEEEYQRFVTDSGGKPLFNRAVDGGYPAASTFKPVTAFASIAQGAWSPSRTFPDNGCVDISTIELCNSGKTVNGPIDITGAIKASSNVFFGQMGAYLNSKSGPLPLSEWAKRLGYGRSPGIDLPGGGAAGNVPDRDWRAALSKEEAKCRRKEGIPIGAQYPVTLATQRGCGITDMRDWSVGDNVNLAIGQGDVLVSPLQEAVAYSAIENGGKIVRPHLAKAAKDRTGATVETFPVRPRRTVDLEGTGALESVRRGLFRAANEPGGTSYDVFGDWPRERYPIHAKTGTGQTTDSKGNRTYQSWYAAYVPDEKRPIVVICTVENGGYGAATAAPIVGRVLQQWYGLDGITINAGSNATL